MVMTTGEFEFDTIFYAATLDYAAISYILWIIFIIFMPVLLTNLLVCTVIVYLYCCCVYICVCVCVRACVCTFVSV